MLTSLRVLWFAAVITAPLLLTVAAMADDAKAPAPAPGAAMAGVPAAGVPVTATPAAPSAPAASEAKPSDSPPDVELTAEEKAEKEARKVCKADICSAFRAKQTTGADVSCTVVKSWRKEQLGKLVGKTESILALRGRALHVSCQSEARRPRQGYVQ